MNEQDPILADELNRRITADIQGQSQPVISEAIQQEAELAAELITLAHDTHPDPDFVANLGSQLARRAARKAAIQKKQAPPERPSFWQELEQLLKEGTTMNRNKYLLGALGALVLIIAGVFILMNWNNTADSEPIAAVTDSDGQNGDDASSVTDETVVESVDEATEVADLPSLPRLEGDQATGVGGGGGGNPRPQSGGGGDFAESAELDIADSSFIYTDPFSGTTFTLNTTLPADTVLASVLQNVPDEAVSAEQARELATRFGFTGQLYREQYPIFEEAIDGPAYEPPIIYHAFDGSRNLVIDPWGAYYNDSSIMNDFENPLPFEQAVPIAEAFLNERGLLDFDYEVMQIWGTDVNFVRKVDGQPVNQPELTIGVSHEGRIFFVSYQVLRNAEILGRYPLISAAAAWEILQSGVVENNIPYTYGIGPEFAVAEPAVDFIEDPTADLYQFWMREYAPGDEIHLYEWPIIFIPVDSDAAPRVQIRNYVVQADAATLNALVEQVGQQVHLWGQVGANGDTIELAGWETIDSISNPISGPGLISRLDDQVLFTSDENGSTYIVPDAPADLEDGLGVYMFGWAARDLGQAYPVLDWENIDKIVFFPEEPIEEPFPLEEPEIIDEAFIFEPFVYETFAVNEVSLAYYYSYSWPTNDDGEFRYEGQPTVIIQPTWKFAGETDTGDVVEFFVQATEAQYLQQ